MSDALLKWRRTSFTRLDGSVEVAADDWVLKEPGRIYRIIGGRNMTVDVSRTEWHYPHWWDRRGDRARWTR